MKQFWNLFQSYLGKNKLPDFIIQILESAGYDTAISVQSLNEHQIEQIEKFVEININKDFLKDTVYDSEVPFKFLPGHVALLLGAKSYIEKYIDENLKRKYKKPKLEVVEIVDTEQNTQLNTELNTDTEEKLKKLLIFKVISFNKTHKIPCDNLSTENISEHFEESISSSGRYVYKCSLRCHLCPKTKLIPCIYTNYWQISNLEKHLKNHSIRCVSEQNREQLDNLLDSSQGESQGLS